MAGPIQIVVDDPRFPSGRASLPQILASTWGTQAGQFVGCATTGWRTGAYVHLSVQPLAGVVATTGGAVLAFTPPEGLPILVTRVSLYVITKSTGAATLNIGVAADGVTSANNLITACDIGTNSAVPFDNITDVGASGKSRQLMTGTQKLTVTGTADSTGFVGLLLIEFIRATATGM